MEDRLRILTGAKRSGVAALEVITNVQEAWPIQRRKAHQRYALAPVFDKDI